MTYQYLHADSLFSSKQFVSILKIKKNRKLSIDFEREKLLPTSQFGVENKALAAINAGFFDMKKGGSVTFLKVDDEVINPQLSPSQMLSNHAIGIDEKGRLSILPFANPNDLSDPENYDDVLFTGPLLLLNGEIQNFVSDSFNEKRHPRTCVCTLKRGGTLMVAVDGRSKEAQGMSTMELAQLMKQLNCQNAINLDGGGSTTLWLAGKGVLNHPSDNRAFDPKGERKVANVLLVH